VPGCRHLDTSLQLDLQLRNTTRASITEEEVKLDLDVETYNYLRTRDSFWPRVLVVLVMPAEEAHWVNQSPDELAIRHCAYWLSLRGYPDTPVRCSIRVGSPLASLFSVEAINARMERIQERGPHEVS
jgi:hypothetical protein